MKIDWDEFERTQGEFKHGGEDCMERSDQEHPEQAYRRGVQHGAYFILEALDVARGSIDRKLLANIRRYAITPWRAGATILGD